jgi:hypothetical protein
MMDMSSLRSSLSRFPRRHQRPGDASDYPDSTANWSRFGRTPEEPLTQRTQAVRAPTPGITNDSFAQQIVSKDRSRLIRAAVNKLREILILLPSSVFHGPSIISMRYLPGPQ